MFFLSFPVLLFLKIPTSCGAGNCPGQHNLNFANGSVIVDILEVSQIAKYWRENLRRTCGSSRACPKPVRCDVGVLHLGALYLLELLAVADFSTISGIIFLVCLLFLVSAAAAAVNPS